MSAIQSLKSQVEEMHGNNKSFFLRISRLLHGHQGGLETFIPEPKTVHHHRFIPVSSILDRLVLSQTRMLSTTGTDTIASPTLGSSNKPWTSGQQKELSMNRSDDQLKSIDRYFEAIRDLNSLQSNTKVLALAKYKCPSEILPLFRRQMELAGIKLDELNKLNIIHVSGTKGKGSTCAFTESILVESGLKVGMYNSPHLMKVTERIRINGMPIEEESFSFHFRHIFDRLVVETERERVPMPSYFSFLTILAFHIFLAEKTDCAIIEVGIGGEYDPTNIVQSPVACGITTLDFDHTNILGSSIESIAWAKAGIAKPGAPIFTYMHECEEALRVIESRAIDRGSPIIICDHLADLQSVRLGISGYAQCLNASLACQMADYFLRWRAGSQHVNPHDKIASDAQLPKTFRSALAKCSWLGRCQKVEFRRSTLYIDGAHTKKSMKNCIEWFKHESDCDIERGKLDVIRILLINVIGDRDKREVLRPLAEFDGFDIVLFSTNCVNQSGETAKSETFASMLGPNNERSLENMRLNESAWDSLKVELGTRRPKVLTAPNITDAIRTIDKISRDNSSRRSHVLATGSLHFVGAILETLPALQELNH